MVEWLRKELVFLVTLGLILTLLVIFWGIQVKSEYGWRRFDLDERQGFTDYSIVVHSSGWRSGFRASRESQGADDDRVVDLGHNARCQSGWHVVHCL
ncbi:hypothetical protein Hdeb2414_s0003g00097991 [Helianthus debilis subsp. tardiflorus]